MASKALSALLGLFLVMASPGTQGCLLFAQTVIGYRVDPKTSKVTSYTVSTAPPVKSPNVKLNDLIDKLRDPALAARGVSQEYINQTISFVRRAQRSGGDAEDEETAKALDEIVKDLDDAKKDPMLTLNNIYERVSPFARKGDEAGTYVEVLSQGNGRQVVAVRNSGIGKTLFFQESMELGFKISRKVIRRPYPNDPSRQALDAVLVETEKGAATEQKVAYNRKLVLMFKNIKKFYYDQCSTVRRINNGSANPEIWGPEVEQNCKHYQGWKDETVTDRARHKMREEYKKKRDNFPPKILEYLASIEKLENEGRLGELAEKDLKDLLDMAKELEDLQRGALKYYGANQLEMMQKMVVIQLTYYFAQVTNTTPQQSKDSKEGIGPDLQDMPELQKVLDEYKNGNLEGYGSFIKIFDKDGQTLTKLNAEDPNAITPELMALASEAFAYVGFAVKARERALASSINEEIDAAVEESQHWMKLAQAQLQAFELSTLAIQVKRLEQKKLRDKMGIADGDSGMKAQADSLSKKAAQYLSELGKASLEAKQNLLKQILASFYLTYLNASNAYLFDETLKERIRTLSAKAGEIEAIYIAREFEKAKGDPAFRGWSEENKLNGNLYTHFQGLIKSESLRNQQLGDPKLREWLARIQRNSQGIEKFIADLGALSSLPTVEQIRSALRPLMNDFRRLAMEMGFEEIPDVGEVKKETQQLGLRESKLFSAAQNFSSILRIFDQANELQIYIDHYGSTKNTGGFWSFKWVGSFLNFITGGLRDKGVDKVHEKLSGKAWEKLGANSAKRAEVLALLRAGNFDKAAEEIGNLDAEARDRAVKEYEADKAEEDPFDELDFDSFAGKAPSNKNLAVAQGVLGGLFNHLQKFILAYMGAEAIVDTVITSILPISRLLILKVAETVRKVLEVLRLMKVLEALRKVISALKSLARLPIIRSWVRNFQKAWSINKVPAEFRAMSSLQRFRWMLREVLLVNIPRAFLFNIKNTLMMASASAGMQWVAHKASPKTSQYKSGWDALGQGALGGAAFGAKGNLIMMMSPVPAAEFGAGRFGNFMRGLAEMPGPATFAVQTAIKVARPAGLVASEGLIGAAVKASLTRAPMYRMLVGAAVFGWSFVDGAAKYWLAAEVPGTVARVGRYHYNSLMESLGGSSPEAAGATSHVAKLEEAQAFSMTVMQAAWLFVPTNPMLSAKEIKQQAEEFKTFNYLMYKGYGRNIEAAKEGELVKGVGNKPWYLRSIGELWRGEREIKFTANKQWIELAKQQRMKKSYTLTEKMAVGTLTSDNDGKTKGLKDLVLQGLKDGEVLDVHFDAAGGKSEKGPSEGGPALFGKPAQGDAVDLTHVRITNDTIEAMKTDVTKALRKNKGMRKAILEAKGSYTFEDPKYGKVSVSGGRLELLKNLASQANIEAKRSGPFGFMKAVLGRIGDMLSGRKLSTQADLMVRDIAKGIQSRLKGREEPAAEDIIRAAMAEMDERIASASGSDRLALNHVRRALEKDAFIQYANKRLVKDILSYQKGRLTEEGLSKAVDRIVEIWELGVMGKLKVKNAKGEEVLLRELHPEYEMRDAFSGVIPQFKDLQKQALMDDLKSIAKGERLNFNLLETSGGKTLLGFVLLSFMDVYARQKGYQGASFVTVRESLVAQAKEAYEAFFKGRKPSFEIITFSELMARQAQSEEMGTLSPFDTQYMYWDEADQPAMEVALSLGRPNGMLSYVKSPVYQAVKDAVEKAQRELYKEEIGVDIEINALDKALEKNPKLKEALEGLIEQAADKIREGRRSLRSPKSMDQIDLNDFPGRTKKEVLAMMLKEDRNAFGSVLEVGVIERQFGTIENWLRQVLKGALIARSRSDQRKAVELDPDIPEKIRQYHHDTPYSDLDTETRTADQVIHNVPIDLPYDNLVITDFARLHQAAKKSKTIIVGASGTLARGLMKLLAKDIGWKIHGKGTDLPEKIVIKALEGVTELQDGANMGKEFNGFNLAEKAKGSKLRKILFLFVDSMTKAEELHKLLDAAGVPPERRSVLAEPGMSLAVERGQQAQVEAKKNKQGLKEASVDVAIVVGEDGLRGMDQRFTAYGELHFVVTNPNIHNPLKSLPEVSLKQLYGRAKGPRAEGAGVKVSYYISVQAQKLRGSAAYKEIVREKLQDAAAGKDAKLWMEVVEKLKDKVKPGEALDEARIRQLIKDPMLYEAADLFTDYEALAKLKNALTEGQMKEALEKPGKLEEVMVRPDVIGAVLLEVLKVGEIEALRSGGVDPGTSSK